MHELGVAFVQRDKHGRGFLWSSSRLLPSQAGRLHSEKLLAQFREICERLEMAGVAQQHHASQQKFEERQALAAQLWDWSGGTGPVTEA